jgi:hypothetical protein
MRNFNWIYLGAGLQYYRTQTTVCIRDGTPVNLTPVIHLNPWAWWPDEFVKKIALNVSQPIFCQNIYLARYNLRKDFGFIRSVISEKTAQSKQLPNNINIAPSGHPARHRGSTSLLMRVTSSFSPHWWLITLISFWKIT